jgi:hypothetical protein
MRRIYILLFTILTLAACGPKKPKKAELPKIQFDFIRFDRMLATTKSIKEMDLLLKKNPEITVGYFHCTPEKISILAKNLFALFQNPELKNFYKQSQEPEFYGGNQLEIDLKAAFQEIHNQFPQTKVPKIRTVFSGFGGIGIEFAVQHLYLTDTLIVVGLDFFMGKKGKYSPPNVYEYQMRRLEPKALVGQIVLQYSAFFNQQDSEDHSLLSDMIWYGKGFVFTKKILPSLPDSLLFGYTGKELAETEAFQSEVWEHFIDKSLLFKKEEYIKVKYVGERPKTPEIGPACPGSIGRWLGWRIVELYTQQNNKIDLPKLMANKEANKIFLASGYRGKL